MEILQWQNRRRTKRKLRKVEPATSLGRSLSMRYWFCWGSPYSWPQLENSVGSDIMSTFRHCLHLRSYGKGWLGIANPLMPEGSYFFKKWIRLRRRFSAKGDLSMVESTTNMAETPKSKTFEIVRKIVIFTVLGIVAFICFMVAARKFGWF